MAALHTAHRATAGGGWRTLLLAAALAFAIVLRAQGVPHAESARDSGHRCGFDELEARTRGTRVSGISRVVPPPPSARGANAVAPPAAGSAAAWQPIRIRVFTDDLEDDSKYCTQAGETRPDFSGGSIVCTSEDILTQSKKTVLTDLLIPSAIRLHEERLSVQPVYGNLVVDPSISGNGLCSYFTVPSSHTTTGISGADFVLYLAAGPTAAQVGAWATTCQYFAGTGRPAVGVSNASPKYISADPQMMRMMAHELLHALGFTATTFISKGLLSMEDLRGKGPSPVLVSPNVVAKAREQYGCPTQTFMELEDQGGSGTISSHWKRRSAKDELMAGMNGVSYYTALTIAAMEDTGFYKGNYSKAEPMPYGRNAGCDLLTSKCVVNDVSKFTEMFCGFSTDTVICTSDHRALGSCDIEQLTNAIPSHFQYFSDPTLRGIEPMMDYCPVIMSFTQTGCLTTDPDFIGSTFGVNSRCFNVPSGFAEGGMNSDVQEALCADVQCSESTYSVKVAGASSYTTCTPGATLSLANLSTNFSSGSLICPGYDDVCVGQVNAEEYERYRALTK